VKIQISLSLYIESDVTRSAPVQRFRRNDKVASLDGFLVAAGARIVSNKKIVLHCHISFSFALVLTSFNNTTV
jgi:hypothetical protein